MCTSRSTVALAMALGISSLNPAGFSFDESATELECRLVWIAELEATVDCHSTGPPCLPLRSRDRRKYSLPIPSGQTPPGAQPVPRAELHRRLGSSFRARAIGVRSLLLRIAWRDDLDLMAGVVLAAILATLGAIGVVADEVVQAAVLATLGLLVGAVGALRRSLSTFETRRKSEVATLSRLEVLLTDGSIASRSFVFDFPDLRPLLAESSEVLVIAGLSLKTTVGSYYSDLGAAAARGATIRIACPDPDIDALMRQAALASGYRSSSDEAARDVRTNLDLALHLRGSYDTVEVGTLDVLPTMGFIRFRSSTEPEALLIKLLPFNEMAGRYPVFKLRSDVDNELFQVLSASADKTWQAAHVVAKGEGR